MNVAASWESLLAAVGADGASARALQIAAFEQDILRFGRARNLISRREPEQRLRELLSEAIQAAGLCMREHPLGDRARIADLGSGAGIPGIPWAIVQGRAVDLLERREGRVDFLERELRALKLEACQVLGGDARLRAEDPAFEPYDLVLAKAVAQPTALLGWVASLLHPEGRLCLFSRPKALEGLRLEALGWEVQELPLSPDPCGPVFAPSALQLLRRSIPAV